jgi:4-hydroxybutyrate CoA-transferase
MNCKEEYKKKLVSMEDAAKQIKSGDLVGVAIGFGSCSPEMFHAILDRGKELKNVIINDCVQLRPSKLYDIEYMKSMQGHIDYAPNFGMPLSRKILESRMPDYYGGQSCDLADRYAHWSDVFITQVRPPNEHGYINLGLTNFYTLEAVRFGRAMGKQRLTIGEVNDQLPVVHGNNWLHVSDFDFFYENSFPVPKLTSNTRRKRKKNWSICAGND